jgi:hypothetical protein
LLAVLAFAVTLPACVHTRPSLPESHRCDPAPQTCTAEPSPPDTAGAEDHQWFLLDQEVAAASCSTSDWFDYERLDLDFTLACDDYAHYYTGPKLTSLALAVALAAPLANTSGDHDVQRWYQQRVRVNGLDTLSDVANYGGQLWVALPICMEAAAVTGLMEAGPFDDGGFHEWAHRSLRATAVGYPPVIALYFLLGSARPTEGTSRWQPFQDWHGVSGHTFIGAIPFLTAAAMTDDPLLKAPLFVGSLLTGWSRIHDDQHYLSQVALGWWLAYLAVRAVDDTQTSWKNVLVTPTLTPEGPGVCVLCQF